MDLVTPGFGLVFWTAITFIFLLLILKKFAWKPILGAVSDREEGIIKALTSAENARKEMKNLQADNERILKAAHVEREEMLKEARDIKNKIIDYAKSEAQEQANKMIAQAQAAIKSEKKAAMVQLKNHVAGLSVEIAEKVMRNELSKKDKQLKFIETMLGEKSLTEV